jgi:hypothetical protein
MWYFSGHLRDALSLQTFLYFSIAIFPDLDSTKTVQ